MNAAQEFRQAIAQSGLVPPAVIPPGKLIRFPGAGKSNGNTSGWAWIAEDGEGGAYGDWASGLSDTWQANRSTSMTAAERTAHTRRVAELQRIRQEEEKKAHAAAAKQAQAIWKTAQPAGDLMTNLWTKEETDERHAYLKRKQIRPHGLRVDRQNQLIVPVMIDNSITSAQFISPDPDTPKKFLPGGKVKGGSFVLGDLTEATTILICEGYATGASLFEATPFPVVAAFSAGNLLPVAQGLRAQYPTAKLVLCGDHDTSGVGQVKAREAADTIGGLVALPEAPGQDWNDVHTQRGLDAVQMAIEAALTTPQERPMSSITEDAPEPKAPRGTAKDKGLVKELADTILTSDHFARDRGGELYVFERGTYRPRGDAAILRHVKAILEANGDTARWSSHRAREVAEFIRVDARELWERPPSDVVNVANGLLDLTTSRLREHSPDHLSPVQLPVMFDPSARCPQWESFAARVLPADCQTLPFEIVASAMRGEITDQKAVLCAGSGDNGKSTLMESIINFLGHENVSTLALQRLEIDRFAVVRLLGKLANICADLPSEHLAGTSTFKALTGGDLLTAERKFQGSFEFSSFARLLFSTNHFPQSKDASHAFFRRWLVVPFDAVLDPGEKIANFAAHLSRPGELSGVLNRALSVVPEMVRRGGFSQSESTQAALMEFRETTDPLAAWLDRFTVLLPDSLVSRKDLAISYNAASEAASRPAMTAKAFCAAVRRLRPTVSEAQRSMCGQVQWVFQGVALANSMPPPSHRSHHSHHFSQISLEDKNEREEEEKRLNRGNDVNDVSPSREPIDPCFACRGVKFWRSIHGSTVCGTCHPPQTPELVAEWIGGDGAPMTCVDRVASSEELER